MANSWGAFNPNNLGGKTLDSLRNDIYSGFRTKTQQVRGRRTKYGYAQGSTKQVFNAGYYKDHPGWGSIGDKLGININSQNDVRQLFDYVNGYKPPAPAAPAPQAAPTPQAAPAPEFEQRLQKIQQTNTSNTDALMKQMAADRKSYEDLAAKQAASIKSYQNAFNQGSSVGGQESALMINPAQSTATKKKRTSKGTQQFNRNLKISNVSI